MKMFIIIASIAVALVIVGFVIYQFFLPKPALAEKSVFDFTMKDVNGKEVKLEEFRGKVVMIVNVASKCGFTPQYEGLQKIYAKYKDRGFIILGFPANNFLWQEPGSDNDIKAFCSLKYNVAFPIFSKISVLGADKHPLYRFLTEKATDPQFAGEISWNFNKFLLDQNGKVINRFGTRTEPESKEVIDAIESALNKTK